MRSGPAPTDVQWRSEEHRKSYPHAPDDDSRGPAPTRMSLMLAGGDWRQL